MPAPLPTLAEVAAAVRRLGAAIDAPAELLPTFGHTEDFARPHVEVDADGLHLVVVERGQERGRTTVQDLDALLEAVFRGVTFSMATDYEVAHRVPMRDVRRLLFARQVELLGRLSPDWAAREAARHADILRRHPFDDRSDLRMRIGKRLIADGMDPDAAWARAEALVPRPTPEGGPDP